ncbi:MAG: DUF4340 domain-containing protein [Anaerolineae bacterium]|nr:DUF4340 domain-containing protein [Anaerolineae bacterium]
MKRHQKILIAILAVQLVVSVILLWPKSVATGSSEPVFTKFTADDIVSLDITDDQNVSIVLEKKNGEWVLPAAGDYPVKVDTVTPILENLVKLDKTTLVAQTEASHKQLQVSKTDFQRRIIIRTDGKGDYVLYLGSAPRYTATNFRVEGQSEVYQTPLLSSWELNTRANMWVDTAYVTTDQTTISQVILENAQGTVTLVKDGENWTLSDLQEGEEVSLGKVNALVRNASTVTLMTPLGTSPEPEYGMDAPLAKVTLVTADGTRTLQVGARNTADSTYVVKSSESPYYVRVAEYNIKAMVEDARQAFLVEPESETESETAP